MPKTPDYEYYWGTVVDALACIYLYQKAATEDFKYQIRYKDFPDAVNRVRLAYYYCEVFPHMLFGLMGEDVDEFFSDMLLDQKHLGRSYNQALDHCCTGTLPIPLRLL